MKTDIQTRLKPFCPDFHLPSTHIGFFFENDNFFLCYQKNSVRFCPSTRLKTTWLKKGPIFYGSMHIYWYSTPWRNSFPKTSIFVHPHECSKMASSKPLLWEHFWKDVFSMAIFTWYMWTVGQNQKKICVFKQQQICVDGASCWSATNIYMGKLHGGWISCIVT